VYLCTGTVLRLQTAAHDITWKFEVYAWEAPAPHQLPPDPEQPSTSYGVPIISAADVVPGSPAPVGREATPPPVQGDPNLQNPVAPAGGSRGDRGKAFYITQRVDGPSGPQLVSDSCVYTTEEDGGLEVGGSSWACLHRGDWAWHAAL
jgi:hypothetical protein